MSYILQGYDKLFGWKDCDNFLDKKSSIKECKTAKKFFPKTKWRVIYKEIIVNEKVVFK